MQFVKATTKDNLILQGMLFSSNKPSKNIIIHIHGTSGNCWENSFIKQMAEDYPNNNIDFLTVETRGSEHLRHFYKTDGSSILKGNAHELFQESTQDIDAWIEFAKNYKEIYLQGHSFGSSKIANYAATNKVSGLIFISPTDMHGYANQPTHSKEHNEHLNESNKLIESGNEKELLKGQIFGWIISSAKSYQNMFGNGSKAAIFNFFNPKLGFKVINQINVPMLAITGTKDDGLCTDHEASFKTLKKEAKNCPKFQTAIYKGAEHQFKGYEKEIVRDVLKFVN